MERQRQLGLLSPLELECDYSPKRSHQHSHPPHALFTFHCFPHFQRSSSPLDPDLIPADSSCISDAGCPGQDAGYQYNLVIYDWPDGFFPPLFFHLSFPENRTLFRGSRPLRLATSGGLVSVCQPGRTTFLFNADPSTTATFFITHPRVFFGCFFPPDIKHFQFKKPVA